MFITIRYLGVYVSRYRQILTDKKPLSRYGSRYVKMVLKFHTQLMCVSTYLRFTSNNTMLGKLQRLGYNHALHGMKN